MYGFTGVSPTCPPGLPSVMKWLNLWMRREQCMLLPLSSASLSALFPSLCWYQGSGCCGLGKALTGLGGSGGPQCVPGWPQAESGDKGKAAGSHLASWTFCQWPEGANSVHSLNVCKCYHVGENQLVSLGMGLLEEQVSGSPWNFTRTKAKTFLKSEVFFKAA